MQLTFLLSLVNGILDVKLITGGKYVPNLETFNPLQVLQFIIAIFKAQTDLQGTQLVYETVKAADLEEAFSHDHNRMLMA